LIPYRPMPPLIEIELPDGRVQRILAVGLNTPHETTGIRHRIVGVNLGTGRVLLEMPDVPSPSNSNCGPTENRNCSEGGAAQQANVKISHGSTVLWNFTVVRPSASSGKNGSGIELRFVNYKSKEVLYRAHVPILNVQYIDSGANC